MIVKYGLFSGTRVCNIWCGCCYKNSTHNVCNHDSDGCDFKHRTMGFRIIKLTKR